MVDLETNSMSQSGTIKGSVVSFHQISYNIPQRKGPCCCGARYNKKILQCISGIMKPGMNAILGPTGSGKSSILDILAGRKNPKYISGQVLIDGHKQPDNFKCMSGYVVQDDVVMGTLTVRENLYFSANLRLPPHLSSLDKTTRVSQVIQDLGLNDCADTRVGTAMLRGVSGGERKRTNIGMELIISPSVLFLDEPTTGLDASTANVVMMLLHNLSRRGRTIIFSIHQPRYSIFKLFDSITLLHMGRLVYAGPSADALHYFEEQGFVCEQHNNPPDFFLDVINGDLQPNGRSKSPIDFTKSDEHLPGGSRANLILSGDHSGIEVQEEQMAQQLATKFASSSHYKSILDEVNPILENFNQRVANGTEVAIQRVDYVTSFCYQLAVVSKRSVLNIVRNPQTSFLQSAVMAFFALIVGGIFFQLDNDLKGVGNRVGASFFVIMNMIFGNLSAVELFISERVIFIHENSSGFYRVSSYFLAKVFCDVIPMRAVPIIVFSAVTYWMIGFQVSGTHFLIYTAALLSTGICGAVIAFCISAGFAVFAIANLLVAMTFVIMMVFSGLFINLTSMGVWINWLRYISVFRYSISLLTINELKDMKFCNKTMTPPLCLPLGNQYLEDQGIAYKTEWDLYQNLVALWSIIGIVLILCYVQLRGINKYK